MKQQQLNIRITPTTRERLEVLATQHGSITAAVEAAVDALWQRSQRPAVMLGYWQVGGGELDADDECVGCGNPVGPAPWLGIDADYRICGLLCASCASSD